jgi:hypothetical protein
MDFKGEQTFEEIVQENRIEKQKARAFSNSIGFSECTQKGNSVTCKVQPGAARGGRFDVDGRGGVARGGKSYGVGAARGGKFDGGGSKHYGRPRSSSGERRVRPAFVFKPKNFFEEAGLMPAFEDSGDESSDAKIREIKPLIASDLELGTFSRSQAAIPVASIDAMCFYNVATPKAAELGYTEDVNVRRCKVQGKGYSCEDERYGESFVKKDHMDQIYGAVKDGCDMRIQYEKYPEKQVKEDRLQQDLQQNVQHQPKQQNVQQDLQQEYLQQEYLHMHKSGGPSISPQRSFSSQSIYF